MATRSYIGQLLHDRTVRYVYCHSDGYPWHNGAILETFWTDRNRVAALLDKGDLSYLGQRLGRKHDFNDFKARGNGCRFYGRDRGETGIDAKRCELLKYVDPAIEGEDGLAWSNEFHYLQGLNGRWLVWSSWLPKHPKAPAGLMTVARALEICAKADCVPDPSWITDQTHATAA